MRTERNVAVIFVSCLLAGALAGCGLGARPIDAWVVSEMVQLTDRLEPQGGSRVYSPDGHVIRLPAGANEAVSFQIAVDAEDQPLSNLTLTFSDLNGPQRSVITSGSIAAYRMWPIRIDSFPAWYIRLTDRPAEPAGFYDPLTPIDHQLVGQPFHVPAGQRLAVWVDILVPHDTRPGLYTGQVRISADGRRRWVGKIKLQVHEYALPDANPIVAVGGLDYRDVFRALVRVDGKAYVPYHLARRHKPVREGLTLIREMMRIAHAHRLDLFDRALHPAIKRKPDGSIRLDWTDYDAIVLPYLSGSAFDDKLGCAAWPMPFRQDWPPPRNYGGPDSQAYRQAALGVVRSTREHFAALGEFGRQMFYWPYRGDVSQEGYDNHATLARIVRTADDRTPIFSRLPLPPPSQQMVSPADDFAQLADAYAPPGQWFNARQVLPDSVDRHKLAGLWLTPGAPPFVPPVGVLASPGDLRALPWLVARYNCKGLFFPEVLNWQVGSDGALSDSQLHFFYPGTIVGIDGILASASLKRLRRGMQDVAGVWILQQRQRPGVAAALVNCKVRYAGLDAAGDNYLDARLDGWITKPETWDYATSLLAREIQSAVHPETYTGREQLAEQLAWQKFDREVHSIRIETARARVTPASWQPDMGPTSVKGMLRATVSVELLNEYGRGVAVSVRLGKLPPGWRAVKAVEQIQLMPPGTRRQVKLVAEGDKLPISGRGKTPLELIVTSEQGQPKRLLVEAPMIRCAASSRKITIDGKLDDWPMRAGNSAGAFKLLGRRGRLGEGLAAKQTSAFVLRQADKLLIAMRCEEPNPAAIATRADNMVRYSQLMAVGEDLVEIMLDPGCDARSPAELYHIVVKANGVVITEKGVNPCPPVGQAAPWPAEVRAAVGRGEDYWSVELAVDLSSFGADADSPVWGIDFARFSPGGNEASSWSGASRYFYDPKQLGTMLLGQQ